MTKLSVRNRNKRIGGFIASNAELTSLFDLTLSLGGLYCLNSPTHPLLFNYMIVKILNYLDPVCKGNLLKIAEVFRTTAVCASLVGNSNRDVGEAYCILKKM